MSFVCRILYPFCTTIELICFMCLPHSPLTTLYHISSRSKLKNGSLLVSPRLVFVSILLEGLQTLGYPIVSSTRFQRVNWPGYPSFIIFRVFWFSYRTETFEKCALISFDGDLHVKGFVLVYLQYLWCVHAINIKAFVTIYVRYPWHKRGTTKTHTHNNRSSCDSCEKA